MRSFDNFKPAVVFENHHFVVVVKPSGCLTVPSRYPEEDDRFCLGTELEKHFERLWPVHRLDFEVSGLVIFARNTRAHQNANTWFERNRVQKAYFALTRTQDYDHWPREVANEKQIIAAKVGAHFDWTCKLDKGKRRAFISDRGKLAVTRADILNCNETHVLWKLTPLTGRSHQLRFELSRHGFPILGDELYGGQRMPTIEEGEIALRSVELNFAKVPFTDRFGLPETIQLMKDQYLQTQFGIDI